MSKTVQSRLNRLEKYFSPTCPGTSLSKTMLDHKLCDFYKVQIKKQKQNKGYQWVWFLSLGKSYEPKLFICGNSISECLTKAEHEMDKREHDSGKYTCMGYKLGDTSGCIFCKEKSNVCR